MESQWPVDTTWVQTIQQKNPHSPLDIAGQNVQIGQCDGIGEV